MTIESICFS